LWFFIMECGCTPRWAICHQVNLNDGWKIYLSQCPEILDHYSQKQNPSHEKRGFARRSALFIKGGAFTPSLVKGGRGGFAVDFGKSTPS
jgi:hypothetical protein